MIKFSGFLDSAKVFKTTNLAKVTFAFDRSKIDPMIWAKLTTLELQDDVLLNLTMSN